MSLGHVEEGTARLSLRVVPYKVSFCYLSRNSGVGSTVGFRQGQES